MSQSVMSQSIVDMNTKGRALLLMSARQIIEECAETNDRLAWAALFLQELYEELDTSKEEKDTNKTS